MNAVKVLRVIEMLMDAVPPAVNLVAGLARLIEARRHGVELSDAELQEAIDDAQAQIDRNLPG